MSRARHLLKKYGITEETYNDLLRIQRGCCAVCGRHSDYFKARLCVDHDKASGEIRGLLCTYCNRYIVGRHRVDKGLELLVAAVKYLDRPYTGWIVPPKPKR